MQVADRLSLSSGIRGQPACRSDFGTRALAAQLIERTLGGRIHTRRVRTLSMKLRVTARSVLQRTMVSRVNLTFDHFYPTEEHLNPIESHLELSSR
jgi:hypothetical protein